MAETSKATKASDPLLQAVIRSFSAPHFVTLSEVRDSTGFDSRRSADALALGMFRSRGRLLYGFEFKVSRSDWLCELRKPQKAESWFQYCDHWGLIVSDISIVKTGELPAGWGLGVLMAQASSGSSSHPLCRQRLLIAMHSALSSFEPFRVFSAIRNKSKSMPPLKHTRAPRKRKSAIANPWSSGGKWSTGLRRRPDFRYVWSFAIQPRLKNWALRFEC